MKLKTVLKAASAAALLVLSLSVPASAGLKYGWERTYYSDASHSEIVGQGTLYCHGDEEQWWGVATPYFDQWSEPCVPWES